VIDLAEYEVVGIHRIARDKERVADFAIGPDGNLYCPVTSIGLATWLGGGSSGKTIRVINPATGKVVDEIEVSECPLRITTLPGGKALVGHDKFLREEGGFASDVIDMNSNTVAKTFYFKGWAMEILHSPEGKFYIGIVDALEEDVEWTLIEFDPQTNDTVGDPITLRTDFMFETAAFATSSKIYAPKPPAEEALGNEISPSWTLAVLEFPSGNLLKTISVPECPRNIMVVGQKAYVTYFSGSVQTAENQRTVSVIDVNTDQVLKTIEVCPGPQHSAYSESTGKIYVGCVEGKISVIDPSTDKVIETIVCDDARVGGWGFSRIKVPR
jgi:DNA-binding beta-propeller fold protein YncE